MVHTITDLHMDNVITVKKKCNTLLFAGCHEEAAATTAEAGSSGGRPAARVKAKYFFIVVNLITGAKERSDNTASYFVDIPDSGKKKGKLPL